MEVPNGRVPQYVDHQPFDLIVIGAGINGAGIARDAALRGLSVLVLDKSDIGSGTTSYSTRLIHGGLRYLEHFEVSLVRESLHEREALLRIAPHLVHALPFLIPVYQGEKRGTRLIQLGMMAYDVLSYDKSLPWHHMLSREEALQREPGLDPNGLLGAALYSDAQVEFPERLAFENVLDAVEHGATALTYMRVDGFLWEGNTVRGVEFTDLLTDQQHIARAPITVNAAGPWLDELSDGERGRAIERMIGGTKGSHIVVNSFPGAPHEALYVEARQNHRPYFIVPWNHLYLIGTTDLRYSGSLDRIVADESEIEYLVRETNTVIPGANLTRESVLYAYAGVRPLPFQPEGSEGSITRSHIIRDHAPGIGGLISIIGGKLTTYRNLAQQTVDLVYRKMERRPPRSVTAHVPLPGARTLDYQGFAARFRAENGLPDTVAGHLLNVYGTRVVQVLEAARGRSDLLTPLSDGGPIGAEIPFSFNREMAVTLTDALMRRTMAGWGPDMAVGPDMVAAKLAEHHLGWSGERATREVTAYRGYIERYRPRALTSMPWPRT